jgi:type I protein arginine methyltransferase
MPNVIRVRSVSKQGSNMHECMQAPIRSNTTEKSHHEHHRCLDEWHSFVREVRAYYDVDLACLTKDYELEQREYLQQTASWSDVHPGNLLGKTAVIKHFDLSTISLEEVKAPIHSHFELLITRPGPIHGLAGFFDVAFRGSLQEPADQEVCLQSISLRLS